MAITVRVRDFQSIEDATVIIDGFTVISGPNNSGKTALMRAIRGVFTNAPAGPLVRRGTNHLIVDIDFGDGNTVKWEKGWEKPHQKGKTVNKYTVNGVELSDVGRGCPPEVLALGVNPIKAGTDTVWPQVADQFKGVLFLVGSPGSTMAEAIANVDRVGRLNKALKNSEKDRRVVTSTLKVRRVDEKTLEGEVTTFDGLDGVGDLITAVETSRTDADSLHTDLGDTREIRSRWVDATANVERDEGIENVPVVEAAAVNSALTDRSRCIEVRAFKKLHDAAQINVAKFAGIEDVPTPPKKGVEDAKGFRGEITTLRDLVSRVTDSRATVKNLDGCEDVTYPDPARVQKIRSVVSFFSDLRERRAKLQTTITTLEEASEEWDGHINEAEAAVAELLGEMGECPTCGTVVGPDGHHVHKEAS